MGLVLVPMAVSPSREKPPPLSQCDLNNARGGRAGDEAADCATNSGAGDNKDTNADGHARA